MIIGNKYELINKIGSGSFGSIYRGKNIRTDENVAIKIESINENINLLKNETKVYQYLSSFNYNGIPKLKWYGIDEKYNYMVINLLGSSLSKLKRKYNIIPLDITLSLGIQMLERIKFIHIKGLIHRDIKPDNFLLGINENKKILHLIDFGFCKKYLKDDGKHIEIKKLNKIIGTPSFISINIHNLLEPSRRDDLESFVYILLYLYYDKLEWNENYSEEEEKNDNMKLMKINIIKKKELPNVFLLMLNYIRNLEFNEEPNYDYLINLCKHYIEKK